MYWVGSKSVLLGFSDDITGKKKKKKKTSKLGQLNMWSCDGEENVLGYFTAKLMRAEAFETGEKQTNKQTKNTYLLQEFMHSFRVAKSSFKAQVQ